MPPGPDNCLSRSCTSSSLLERAKQHEQAAWEQLVKLYAPLVYRECRVMGVAPQDGPDVVQDVFRKVAGSLGRFHHDRAGDSFRAWLATIARNCIRDYYKSRAHRPEAKGGSEMYRRLQAAPDHDFAASTASDAARGAPHNAGVVRRAIESVRADFEPQTWDAFWKTAVEGLSPLEVASQLGVSKWVVYQARSRVLRRLRQDLEGLLD